MDLNDLILRTTARLLVPVLLLFSIFLLLRGHNEPGGGFIGGLVAAIAFVLYALAADVASARELLRFNPRTIVTTGLAIAAGSGIIGLVAGDSFLKGKWVTLSPPGIDSFYVGTPLLFDIGVFLVVIGMTLMTMLTLAEE